MHQHEARGKLSKCIERRHVEDFTIVIKERSVDAQI